MTAVRMRSLVRWVVLVACVPVVAPGMDLAPAAWEAIPGHPRLFAALVPGDDPGALPGVGGCQLLTDERIEQGRLPGLDLPGDRQPERAGEPGGQFLQFGVGPGSRRLGGSGPEQSADVGGELVIHGGLPLPVSPARCRWG